MKVSRSDRIMTAIFLAISLAFLCAAVVFGVIEASAKGRPDDIQTTLSEDEDYFYLSWDEQERMNGYILQVDDSDEVMIDNHISKIGFRKTGQPLRVHMYLLIDGARVPLFNGVLEE